MKSYSVARSVTIMLTGIFMVAGCAKEGPLAPVTSPETSAGVSSVQKVDMVKLPVLPLQKWNEVTGHITAKDGGKLQLKYEDKTVGSGNKFKLEVEITFEKGSVSNDFDASMGLDAVYLMSNVDLEFGPHGTQFLQPAKLKVRAEGLDLSMFESKSVITLYYEEGDTWVPMEGKVTVDPNKGTLVCDNGLLPHFSRYCFGR